MKKLSFVSICELYLQFTLFLGVWYSFETLAVSYIP